MTNHYEECDFCGELRHRGEKCNPKALARGRGLFATAENHVRQKRKRKAMTKKRNVVAPQWPAPRPIKTAPLKRIMVWDIGWFSPADEGFWRFVEPHKDDTITSWRVALHEWGHEEWLPVPPPPGRDRRRR